MEGKLNKLSGQAGAAASLNLFKYRVWIGMHIHQGRFRKGIENL